MKDFNQLLAVLPFCCCFTVLLSRGTLQDLEVLFLQSVTEQNSFGIRPFVVCERKYKYFKLIPASFNINNNYITTLLRVSLFRDTLSFISSISVSLQLLLESQAQPLQDPLCLILASEQWRRIIKPRPTSGRDVVFLRCIMIEEVNKLCPFFVTVFPSL